MGTPRKFARGSARDMRSGGTAMTEKPATAKVYCPICRKETFAQNTDDCGTTFYKCVQGHSSTKALTAEERSFHEACEIQAEQNGDKTYFDPLNPMAAFLNGKGIFKTALVAQWIQANEHFKIDRATEALFYGDAEKGLWKPKGELYLQGILANLLGEENTKAIYTNVLHDLKGLLLAEKTDITFSMKLGLENGILDPETDEFKKASLDEMALYQLPVAYNPNVDPHKLDNFLEFMKQTFDPDDLEFMQEWSGYLLLPDYRFHAALWIHGGGRNGKGVWDRTMQGILGANNVCKRGLEELDGDRARFSLQFYYHKLYAISSEPATNKVFRTEIFQKITGGDAVGAEVKRSNDLLEFVNCGKLTIIGNKFPIIHNPTTAFKDRMKFVEAPNYIPEDKRIPNLENVWLNDPEQKSAILNWMIEGKKRLLERGYFKQSKSQKQIEILFQRSSDSLTAFITEMAIIDKNLVTTRAAAFESYKNYCDVLGLYAVSEQKFTAKLKEMPKISPTTVNHPSKLRAWRGIGFNEITDDGDIKVSKVSEVSQKGLTTYQNIEQSSKIERVTSDTSDTSDTTNQNSVRDSQAKEVLHFKRLTPNELYKCDVCKGLEAEYQQGINYFCKSCFEAGRKKAELECVFVEDREEEPDTRNYGDEDSDPRGEDS